MNDATVMTWLDGRVQTVPADDPRLAEQERQRVLAMHVANMRRLPLHGRRDYLANVERREGQESAQKLRDAFAADWERRRAAAPAELPATAWHALRALQGAEPGSVDEQPPIDTILLQAASPVTVRFACDLASCERRWIEHAKGLPAHLRPLSWGARTTMRRICVALAAFAEPARPLVSAEILDWVDRFVRECLQVTLAEVALLSDDDDARPDAGSYLLELLVRHGPAGMLKSDLHKARLVCWVPVDQRQWQSDISERFAEYRRLKLRLQMVAGGERGAIEAQMNEASKDGWALKNRFASVRYAYAMTVHKSQGSTFDAVVLDWTSFLRCRDVQQRNRLAYVALTRTRRFAVVCA